MREITRSPLIQSNRMKIRRSFVCRLAMVLCLVTGVAGFALLFQHNIRVSAARREKRERVVAPVAQGRESRLTLLKTDQSEDGLWRLKEKRGAGRTGVGIEADPKFYQTVTLNETAQRKLLSHAPMEFTNAVRQTPVVMTLPMPGETFARFRVEESPVMAAGLAAQSPDTKTYRGIGLDDPTATTRFDMTPAGFHAIVLSSEGTVIIEPARHASRDQERQYISYDQHEAQQESGSFSCVLLGAERASVQSKQLPRKGYPNLGVSSGATLRTYRLALAATAEYTQTFGGGSVSGALSTIITMTNAVNAIYERDLAIHLTLVANETSIIFTNSAADGYTSDNATSLLTQNQSVLDQRIGAANYDLGMVLDGHVYNFQPGKFIFQGAANQFQIIFHKPCYKACNISPLFNSIF